MLIGTGFDSRLVAAYARADFSRFSPLLRELFFSGSLGLRSETNVRFDSLKVIY